jgi:hypothetical protein
MRRFIVCVAFVVTLVLPTTAFASIALEAHPQGIWATTKEPKESAFSTGSFTPPANSLLLVRVQEMGSGTSGALGNPLIAGGGLGYEVQSGATVNLTSSWSVTETWLTAKVGGAPSSMAITVDDPVNRSAYIYIVSVIAFTGYDTASPIGGTLTSGSNAGVGDGAESRELSEAPSGRDITLQSISVDSTLGPPKPSWEAGWEPVHEIAGTANEAGLAIAKRQGSTSKTVAVKDVYTAAGGLFKAGLAAIVVKAAPGG